MFVFLLISNMFIKDELQDYIEAMQNEEAQARAAINVITENY